MVYKHSHELMPIDANRNQHIPKVSATFIKQVRHQPDAVHTNKGIAASSGWKQE